MGGLVLGAALLALSPAAVSAQSGHAVQEPGGSRCAPCYMSADSVGLSALTGSAMGIEYSLGACDDELTIEFRSDEIGRIADQQMHGSRCHRKACGATSRTAVDGDEWPVQVESGAARMAVDMCFASTLANESVRCRVSLGVDELATHRYQFSASHERCSGRLVELTGRWQVVGDGFELIRYDGS
jgi:hypothetical protein